MHLPICPAMAPQMQMTPIREHSNSLISCESSYPSVSVKWGDSEREKSAQKVTHFLSLPSVSAQVILDKATECFSVLKGEQGMTTVFFDHVELRCGVGPDIAWGRIVVRHANW